MTFYPLEDRIIVKPDEKKITADTKDPSITLWLPDDAQVPPMEGEIIAAGPGKEGMPMRVQVGDRILFSMYSGFPVKIEGQVFLCMSASDVLGVWDREPVLAAV